MYHNFGDHDIVEGYLSRLLYLIHSKEVVPRIRCPGDGAGGGDDGAIIRLSVSW